MASNKEYLCKLIDIMYDELPIPKPKRKNNQLCDDFVSSHKKDSTK